MNWRNKFALACLTLFIAGCSVQETKSVSDVHTASALGASQEFVAFRGMGTVVYAQAVTGTTMGKPVHGLKIRRKAGFSNHAYYEGAFSFGREYSYQRTKIGVGACAPFGCDVYEIGSVTLDEPTFLQAASNGLQIRLLGSQNSEVLNIPSSAFKQAMASVPR